MITTTPMKLIVKLVNLLAAGASALLALLQKQDSVKSLTELATILMAVAINLLPLWLKEKIAVS